MEWKEIATPVKYLKEMKKKCVPFKNFTGLKQFITYLFFSFFFVLKMFIFTLLFFVVVQN